MGVPRVFPSSVAVPHRPCLTWVFTSSNSLSIMSCFSMLCPTATWSAFTMTSWAASDHNSNAVQGLSTSSMIVSSLSRGRPVSPPVRTRGRAIRCRCQNCYRPRTDQDRSGHRMRWPLRILQSSGSRPPPPHFFSLPFASLPPGRAGESVKKPKMRTQSTRRGGLRQTLWRVQWCVRGMEQQR